MSNPIPAVFIGGPWDGAQRSLNGHQRAVEVAMCPENGIKGASAAHSAKLKILRGFYHHTGDYDSEGRWIYTWKGMQS